MVVPVVVIPSSSTPLPVESAGSSRSVSPLPSRGRGKRRAVDSLDEEKQQRREKLVKAFKQIREGLDLLEEALV